MAGDYKRAALQLGYPFTSAYCKLWRFCCYVCCWQVSDLDPVDQKLLAPVLRHPVLRQLLVAMSAQPQHVPASSTSSAAEGFNSWLANPRVLQLLREAARALRRGLLTEDQLIKLLQQEVKVSAVEDMD